MVFKYSVLFCKGNYDNGPELSVFSLPKNEDLREKKGLNGIPIENMPHTKNFKVCELHFDHANARSQYEYHYSKAGKLLAPVLSQPKLTDDVVPSVFPGCPAYLSRSKKTGREDPDKKAQRKASLEIENALQLSVDTFKEYEEKISFGNLEQLAIKIKSLQNPDVFTIVYRR